MKKGNMVKGLGLVLVGMLMLASCGGGTKNVGKQKHSVVTDSLQKVITDFNNAIQKDASLHSPTLTEIPFDIAYAYLAQYYLFGESHDIIQRHIKNHQDVLFVKPASMQSLKLAATTANFSHIVMTIAKMTPSLKTIIGNNSPYNDGQLYLVYRFAKIVSDTLQFEVGKSYLVCGTDRMIECTSAAPLNYHAIVEQAMQAYVLSNVTEPQPKTDLDEYCNAAPAHKNEVLDIYYTTAQLETFLSHCTSKSTESGVAFDNIGIYFSENSSETERGGRFEFLHRGCYGTMPINKAKYFDFMSTRP
jgi:hypothetical protein